MYMYTFVRRLYRAASTKLHGNPNVLLILELAVFKVTADIRHNICMGTTLQKVHFMQHVIQIFTRLQLDDLDGA